MGFIKDELNRREIKQKEFIDLIKKKTGVKYGRPFISKLINGKYKNITLKTALIISKSLDVPVEYVIKDFYNEVDIDNFFP